MSAPNDLEKGTKEALDEIEQLKKWVENLSKMTRTPMKIKRFWDERKCNIYLMSLYVITSVLMTLILGWNPVTFAKLLLLLCLNIFSIPLIVFCPIFWFPYWVYYVLVIEWITGLTTYYEFEKTYEAKT